MQHYMAKKFQPFYYDIHYAGTAPRKLAFDTRYSHDGSHARDTAS